MRERRPAPGLQPSARVQRLSLALLALAVSPAVAAAQRLAAPDRLSSVAVPPMLHMAATLPARVSWRASDVALAGAFVLALAIDAAQTRGLARRGWQDYRESNPILGPHPGVGRLNTYTAVAGLTVLGAATAVPARVRPWLLGAALAVETFTIAGNVRRGVVLQFP